MNLPENDEDTFLFLIFHATAVFFFNGKQRNMIKTTNIFVSVISFSLYLCVLAHARKLSPNCSQKFEQQLHWTISIFYKEHLSVLMELLCRLIYILNALLKLFIFFMQLFLNIKDSSVFPVWNVTKVFFFFVCSHLSLSNEWEAFGCEIIVSTQW